MRERARFSPIKKIYDMHRESRLRPAIKKSRCGDRDCEVETIVVECDGGLRAHARRALVPPFRARDLFRSLPSAHALG
jgi:hypothetical protein